MNTHIGFIMDGNRRYSKKNNLEYSQGYEEGMLQFFNIIKWQVKNNIQTTSYYALSLDNAKKRDNRELKIIQKIISKLLDDPQFEQYCVDNKISLNLRGRYFSNNKVDKELLDKDEEKINKLEKSYINSQIENSEFFSKNKLLDSVENKVCEFEKKLPKKCNYFVNIALFYGGVDEIISTTQKLSNMVKNNVIDAEDITEEVFIENSNFPNTMPPNVIVRTGNAPRISGFMLFLSAYSEIYLSPKLWPELKEDDLDEILSWYKKQSRNFGK